MIQQATEIRFALFCDFFNEILAPVGMIEEIISSSTISFLRDKTKKDFPLLSIDERLDHTRPSVFKKFKSVSHFDFSLVLEKLPNADDFRKRMVDFILDQKYKIVSIDEYDYLDRTGIVFHYECSGIPEYCYLDWISFRDEDHELLPILNCSVMTAL